MFSSLQGSLQYLLLSFSWVEVFSQKTDKQIQIFYEQR